MSQLKYLFITDPEVGTPIYNGEGIMVLDPEGAHYANALIANEPHRGEVFAPEINWYLKNTQAGQEEQKEILKKLYEMRFIRYEHSPKKSNTLIINRSVLIIGESEDALALVEKAEHFFEVTHVLPSELLNLGGKFGGFNATIKKQIEEEGDIKEEELEVTCAQLVLCDLKNDMSKYRGVESVNEYSDNDALMKKIRNRIGFYEYKNTINYDVSLCSYHHNEASTCAKCAQICPSFGIVNDDSAKELHFSALDCTACGKCISVCPTGAIDFAPFSQKAFLETVKVCEGKQILLISELFLETLEGCEIPEGYIPFLVETDQIISYRHLKNMFEKNTNTVLLYAPEVSEATQQALITFNEECLLTHAKKAIVLVTTKKELESYFRLTCKKENEDTQRKQHG